MWSSSAKWPVSIMRSASSSTRKRRFSICAASSSSCVPCVSHNLDTAREAHPAGTDLLYDVPETTGRRDKDIDAAREDALLLLGGHASDYSRDAHEGRVLRLALGIDALCCRFCLPLPLLACLTLRRYIVVASFRSLSDINGVEAFIEVRGHLQRELTRRRENQRTNGPSRPGTRERVGVRLREEVVQDRQAVCQRLS